MHKELEMNQYDICKSVLKKIYQRLHFVFTGISLVPASKKYKSTILSDYNDGKGDETEKKYIMFHDNSNFYHGLSPASGVVNEIIFYEIVKDIANKNKIALIDDDIKVNKRKTKWKERVGQLLNTKVSDDIDGYWETDKEAIILRKNKK